MGSDSLTVVNGRSTYSLRFNPDYAQNRDFLLFLEKFLPNDVVSFDGLALEESSMSLSGFLENPEWVVQVENVSNAQAARRELPDYAALLGQDQARSQQAFIERTPRLSAAMSEEKKFDNTLRKNRVAWMFSTVFDQYREAAFQGTLQGISDVKDENDTTVDYDPDAMLSNVIQLGVAAVSKASERRRIHLEVKDGDFLFHVLVYDGNAHFGGKDQKNKVFAQLAKLRPGDRVAFRIDDVTSYGPLQVELVSQAFAKMD